MNLLKKLLPSVLPLVALVVALFAINTHVSKANPFNISRSQTAVATSSQVVMTPGTATTTLTWASDDVDSNGLFLLARASSTATRFNWQYQYANNCISDSDCANGDWFDEDSLGNSIGVNQLELQHSSTTPIHTWGVGATTTASGFFSRKALNIPDVPSRYKRVTVTLPAGSANGMMWFEITKKRQNDN